MRRLLHLSDLHFGRVDSATLEPLKQFTLEKRCDIAVVSGDLTQRARKHQFHEAKAFLDSLSLHRLVVPGNHDIPLYKLWRRFTSPYRNYASIISDDLEPSFIDAEVGILGMNTVSRWRQAEGSWSKSRFRRLSERFHEMPQDLVKVLVTHHPLEKLNQATWKLDFDLMLAGHTHQAEFGLHSVLAAPKASGSSPVKDYLLIQAGTATSVRTRHGFGNSINVIDVIPPSEHGAKLPAVHVQRYLWNLENKSFNLQEEGHFTRTPEGWKARE